MAITAAQVNELRKKTGAGMMDCKKALTEADGDFQKAVEILRKKGAAVAAKRADRSANEGVVMTQVSDDGKTATMIEVNCETDFVAKSDDFVAFAGQVLADAFELKAESSADLMEKKAGLADTLNEITGKVGEKTEISRVSTVTVDDGQVIDYIHPGAKLGVVVSFDKADKASFEKFDGIARDIAMQVAAMNPVAVYRDEVPKETVEKEIEIYKEIAVKEGKPEKILDRIAEGKLNKFFQENCLAEQAYIKDNSKSVGDLIAEFNKENDTDIKIGTFLRFHLSDENK